MIATNDLLKDKTTFEAYMEAKYRRRIARRVTSKLREFNYSERDLLLVVRSKSQVKRLLNEQRGGNLTLLTLVQVSLFLRMSVADMVEE